MDAINSIFGYYDRLLAPLPLLYQALISIALLIFMGCNIYALIKSGKWIFLAVIIVLLPETWPAARKIALILWLVTKGLLSRSQGL